MGLFQKLILVFTLVPLIEFILFWKVGSLIGLPVTIATIIITGVIGAWLTRLQGFKTFVSYQKTISEGKLPHRELIDGILILLAGAVLLTPGFLTDAVGFALLVAPVREKLRHFLGNRLKDKIQVVSAGTPMEEAFGGAQRPASNPDVINVESEVVDETGRMGE